MENSASLDLYVLLFGGTIILMLFAIGVISFIMVYQKRIIKKDLEYKQAEINHSKELFYSTLEATEKERSRLGRDLHDVVGASLSTIRLQLSDAKNNIDNSPRLLEIVEKNKQLIDDTILEVVRISNDLLPPGLEEFGLSYAIEGLCENILEVSDVEISLSVKDVDNVKKHVALIIFRILKELLNNTVKHAEATEVKISISIINKELCVSYEDNGKGFNFKEAYVKRSHGLKNIEVRVKMAKGVLSYVTEENNGLQVKMRFPDYI